MITLDKNSKFVNYWVRWGCTERGFTKLTKGYEKYDFTRDLDERYYTVPPGTNLCQLARICFYAFLKTVLAVSLLTLFVTMIATHVIEFAIAIAGIVIGVSSVVLAVWLVTKGCERIKGSINFSDTLPVQYYKAWKGKYCPMITFEEKPD